MRPTIGACEKFIILMTTLRPHIQAGCRASLPVLGFWYCHQEPLRNIYLPEDYAKASPHGRIQDRQIEKYPGVHIVPRGSFIFCARAHETAHF